MSYYANDALIALINANSRVEEGGTAFDYVVDERNSLCLFARNDGKILLQLNYKETDVDILLTFFDFDGESGVDRIGFTYNGLDMSGYIDKRKTTANEPAIFAMTPAEDDPAVKEAVAGLIPTVMPVCNALVRITLTVVAQMLRDGQTGVSPEDFGYTNFMKI